MINRLTTFALAAACGSCSPVHPQAESVVFASGRTGDGDIYVLELDQDEPQLVVGTSAGEGAPRWDPASARLVYSRFDSAGADLFSGGTRLFRDPNGDVAPVWSIGGRVAYARDVGGLVDLFTAAPDGSTETQVTDDPLIERYPAWDPEGVRLVYAKQLDTGWDLHILDLETGVEQRVTFDGTYVGHPSWSPSGGAIAFDRMFGDQTDIVILRLEDRSTVRVTENDENDLLPSWSADGSRLVFAGERGGNWDVWLYSVELDSVRRLTSDPAFDGGPIFVPGSFPR